MIFNIGRKATKVTSHQRRTHYNAGTKTAHTSKTPYSRTAHTSKTPYSRTAHTSKNKSRSGVPMMGTMKMKSNKRGGGCSCGK